MTVFAKSVSGGFYPVSGILMNDEIANCVKKGEHGSTFGGNPLAMAIAKRAIEVIFEDNMLENSTNMGNYLIEQLRAIKSPLIQEVRGKGLFIGLVLK